jgi:hypothetical protein
MRRTYLHGLVALTVLTGLVAAPGRRGPVTGGAPDMSR